ncbi:MAG: 3-beta hydroxysteroid dehydrogenase, partial [Actinobacteria bacterium]|nr:3-beta hydroxysteroid dehydrogenase [Actinomycetota bacterium]
AAINANPRSVVTEAITGLTERDVHTILVAVPPVTHSARDTTGFIPNLIRIARATGVSGYVGEGTNRWAAGHTLDVATVFRLALDKAPAGSQLFAATEEGIEVREIAEVIGRHLGLPAASVPAEEVAGHFKGFPFITMDMSMPNAATRELLGWEPAHPGLIADLDQGHYFDR